MFFFFYLGAAADIVCLVYMRVICCRVTRHVSHVRGSMDGLNLLMFVLSIDGMIGTISLRTLLPFHIFILDSLFDFALICRKMRDAVCVREKYVKDTSKARQRYVKGDPLKMWTRNGSRREIGAVNWLHPSST